MIIEDNMYAMLEDEYSRSYFNDILQSYYSKNYRAAIVMLYSFVVFDLLRKLKNMEEDGIPSAKTKLKEIHQSIKDGKPYSTIEHSVINYFKEECGDYFRKFTTDIDYLTNLRHRCAHMNLDDETLYTPKDYQVSMLINSMYDNIFSVKSPIFCDILTLAQVEIERATRIVGYISWNYSLEDELKTRISKKFISRMSEESLKKSYKTFLKLIFASNSKEAIENREGLYVFMFVMSEQISRKGYYAIYRDPGITDHFKKISEHFQDLEDVQIQILLSLFANFPDLANSLNIYPEMFSKLSKRILENPNYLFRYRDYLGDSYHSMYDYFAKNHSAYSINDIEQLYEVLSTKDDFDEQEFLTIFAKKVPTFNGFRNADCFMSFFAQNVTKFSKPSIEAVKQIYDTNNQFYNRNGSDKDHICFAILNGKDSNYEEDAVEEKSIAITD